jgi:beta-glucosidase
MQVSTTQPSPEDVSLSVSLKLSPLGSAISTRLQQPSPTLLRVTVSLMVTNFGPYPGAEVIQIYVSDPVSALRRPKRELKGFKKVFLQVGQTKNVELDLDKMAFSYWDDREHSWVVEKGEFVIIAARSADEQDVVLKKTIVIKQTIPWIGL